MLRRAEKEDLPRIVDIHISAFPGFFLTLLGRRFLMQMYRSFLNNDFSIFVVHDEGGKIDGFAVGLLKEAGGDMRLALRSMFSYAWTLIPAIARNPVLVTRRIIVHLMSKRVNLSVPSHGAMLRSIGVAPECRGNGVAPALLKEFERVAQEKGAWEILLTTDADENERAIGFYRKSGYRILMHFNQDNERRMLVLKKTIN